MGSSDVAGACFKDQIKVGRRCLSVQNVTRAHPASPRDHFLHVARDGACTEESLE